VDSARRESKASWVGHIGELRSGRRLVDDDIDRVLRHSAGREDRGIPAVHKYFASRRGALDDAIAAIAKT